MTVVVPDDTRKLSAMMRSSKGTYLENKTKSISGPTMLSLRFWKVIGFQELSYVVVPDGWLCDGGTRSSKHLL